MHTHMHANCKEIYQHATCFSLIWIMSDLHYPLYFSTFSPTSMHHFYNRWPLYLATNTTRSRLFKIAKSGGCTGGSYPSLLQWRLFFQKRPGFRSVFSRDGSRAHPACGPCRAWWGFPWAWTCLSRHCILLCKVEGGHRRGRPGFPWKVTLHVPIQRAPSDLCGFFQIWLAILYTWASGFCFLFSLFWSKPLHMMLVWKAGLLNSLS